MAGSVSLFSILLLVTLTFGASDAQSDELALQTRKIVSQIERKILAHETACRLTRKDSGKALDHYYYLNTWSYDKGSIIVTIINYATPEKANEDFMKGKGTTSQGVPKDISGFGDAAYENVSPSGINSIVFIKGATIVGVEPNLLTSKEQPVIKRFAQHILDTLEGK